MPARTPRGGSRSDGDAPGRYVFVLSHMRSYTTLLCHLLNHHREIDGYAELHRTYTSAADLEGMGAAVAETLEGPLTGRYLLDKVLHDYPLSDEVLGRDDVRAIFTIRAPERVVPSTIRLGLRTDPPDWKAQPEPVVEQYVARLRQLCEHAEAARGRALYFDAEDLVERTRNVLDGIGTFLDLQEPLEERYERNARTGEAGYGDWSAYIGTGTVVPEREDYSDIAVPSELMAIAQDAYRNAVVRLRELG